jgi:prepilin-type N-terminal cleavage/methylation domain-containing protein
MRKGGFSLVEIVIVIAIISVALMSIISFFIFSRGVNFKMARNTEATSLAEEGMEAVRKLRDQSWSENIADLVSGTTYYPVVSGSNWTLNLNNPGLIKGLYTRTVKVENVVRAANSNISTSGTADPDTKKLTVRVSWVETGNTKEVVLTTYITNFQNN